jgi:hypothetical protein
VAQAQAAAQRAGKAANAREDPTSPLDLSGLEEDDGAEGRLQAPATVEGGRLQHPPGGTGETFMRGDAWERAGSRGAALDCARGCARMRFLGAADGSDVPAFSESFCEAAHGNYDSCIEPEKVALLRAAEQESTRMNVLEWYDEVGGGVPLAEWAHVMSPYGVVWKAGGAEVRPVFDCSVSGLNAALAPWPFELVQVEEILRGMFEGCVMGCRDWRHGFYHVVVVEEQRRFLSFRSPVDGRVGRFRCLPFGMAQSPALFCALTRDFVRIAHERLERTRGADGEFLRRWLPGVGADGAGRWSAHIWAYVDDCPIVASSSQVMEEAFQLLDELAVELGVVWKASKDEGRPSASPGGQGITELVLLGARFASAGECTMHLPEAKATAYLESLEEFVGKWDGRAGACLAAGAGPLRGALAVCSAALALGALVFGVGL